MDHVQESAHIRNAALEKIKNIQADGRLSDSGKGEQIATIRTEANKKIAALREKVRDVKADEIETLRKSLFSSNNRGGASETEKITAAMSLRDAVFRADASESPEAALRMIQRARATGDELLAQAVGYVAYERNWHGVVDAFVGPSGSTRDALDKLRALEAPRSAGARFQNSMSFTSIPEQPEERAARVAANAG
jgi:hypothetical protein